MKTLLISDPPFSTILFIPFDIIKYCGMLEGKVFKQLSTNCTLIQLLNGELVVYRKIHVSSDTDQVKDKTQLLMGLSHPNVLKINGCVNSTAGELVMVEEYCKEGSLADPFNLKQSEKLAILKGLSLGLHYLHCEKRIVHGRLEPSRMLLRNGAPVISGTLTSYGDMEDDHLSISFYQPPETNDGVYGYSSDIWSLGAIFLYVILEGDLDIKIGSKDSKLLANQIERVDDPLLRKLMGLMLNQDERLRPSTANILAAIGSKLPQSCRPSVGQVQRTLKATQLCKFNKLTAASLKKLQLRNKEVIREQAMLNDHNAMYLFGLYIMTQESENKQEAKKWMLSAAEKGNPLAYYYLYIMATEIDEERQFVQKGASMNDLLCKWELGRCIGYGWSVFQQDFEKGLQILGELPKDYGDVHLDIGRLTASQMGFTDPYCPEVIEYYEAGSRFGDKQSVQAVGICLYKKDDYARSIVHSLVGFGMAGISLDKEADLWNIVGASYYMLGDILAGRKWYYGAKALGSDFAKGNNDFD